jgi:hypothetical protein
MTRHEPGLDPPDSEDQLERFKREVGAGDWQVNARSRAQRRKSAWNLLLPIVAFPCMVLFTYALVMAGHQVHALLRGSGETLAGFFAGPMRPATFLVLIPSFLVAVMPALMMANVGSYFIGPARRAMEAEVRDDPASRFAASQKALSRVAAWSLAPWVACALCAALFR